MHKLSNLLIGLSLAFLTAFLVYWLYDAYQNEIKALENELHLEIAEQILKDSNIDFPNLLNQTPNLDGVKDIKLKVFVGDSTGIVGEDSLGRLQGRTDKFVFTEFHSSNIPFDNLDTILSSKTGLVISNFTTARRDTFENTAQFKSSILEFSQDLPAQAFTNIIPQIGFAFFLLGMTIIAIWSSQRFYRQQQSALKAKNQFISNMAHELRTPVTTIGIALEAIQNFDVMSNPEQAKSYLQTSRNELNRLNELIERVLSVAKQKDQNNFYNKQEVAFQTIVKEALKVMEPKIKNHQASVEINEPQNPLKLKGDAFHLKNAIQNLVDNALKYNPRGVQIKMDVELIPGHLLFKVSDNGIGIPHQYQKQVFDQFFRVPSGDVHNVKGHGLGLAYVQKTIKAHGGTVDLTSQENIGTTITLKLPLSDV